MPFVKTFHGFIENTTDTLLIIEACRNGILPTVNRRLVERERSAIDSGTIIVFDESESGIKRWTDGFLWSPSRILGNFLVYRELANRESRKIDNEGYSLVSPSSRYNEVPSVDAQQRERALVGSLTSSNTSYNFKKDGLIKKTIRIMVNGNYLHIVNYYRKNDVLHRRLSTPSASPQLACLQISADLMPHLQGYPSQQRYQQQQTGGGDPSRSSSPSNIEGIIKKRSNADDPDHTAHNRKSRVLPSKDNNYLTHHQHQQHQQNNQQQQSYMIYNHHHHHLPPMTMLDSKTHRYDCSKPTHGYPSGPFQQMSAGSSPPSASPTSLPTTTRGYLFV